MPINTIDDYSTTAANNIDLQGFSILGTAAVSNFDNALRELMVDIATSPLASTPIGTADGINTQGTAIASAGTTNLATATGVFVSITGTANIASFGTVTAGAVRVLRFAGALTIAYNATSMILPGGASMKVSAGDVVTMRSLGGGNWFCEAYTPFNSFGKPRWDHISTTTLSAAASWTGLNLVDYRMLRITGFLRPGTDASILWLRTDNDPAGGSFDATAAAYAYQNIYSQTTTVTAFSGSDTEIEMVGSAVGNAVDEGVSFEIIATQWNQSDYTFFEYRTAAVNSAGVLYTLQGTGRRNSATPQEAVQLLFSAGTLSGHVTLEGVRG